MAGWDSAKHPRRKNGEFGSGLGSVRELQKAVSEKHGVALELHGGVSPDQPLVISKIVVSKDKRSTGTGTKAMNDILDYADRHGLTTALTPSSDYGGSKTRLESYYRDFGFVPNKGRNRDFSTTEAMVRPPVTQNGGGRSRMESPAPHPGHAHDLHEYWVHGEGAAKIRWGSPGDFDRCTKQLEEHAHFTPEQAHGYCNLAHHAATGMYPAEHAKLEGHGRAQRMTTYTRSFALEDISVKPGDGRTVEAYAAVFNVPAPVNDQDGEYEEVIDPAAFNRAIEHAKRAKGGWNIPVMFNHGMTIWGTPSPQDSMPIGTPEEIRADARGLFTRTRYHRTQRADEVLEAIREGSISAYSFTGAFHRSDPLVPRGGFRARGGKLPSVRRTESTLKEYGPTPFPVHAGAEVVGMRAEQAALVLSSLPPGEFERLATFFRSGTPLDEDPPEPSTPAEPGPAAEDSPAASWHSGRSPKQMIVANRARFITRHEGVGE